MSAQPEAAATGNLTFAQTAILNIVSPHLVEFLGPRTPADVAGWVRDGHDWAAELPDDLPLPRLRMARSVARRALCGMGDAAWWRLAELIYQTAPAICQAEAIRSGRPEAVMEAPRVADRLQVIALMLVDKRAYSWYAGNMGRLRDRFVARLERGQG